MEAILKIQYGENSQLIFLGTPQNMFSSRLEMKQNRFKRMPRGYTYGLPSSRTIIAITFVHFDLDYCNSLYNFCNSASLLSIYLKCSSPSLCSYFFSRIHSLKSLHDLKLNSISNIKLSLYSTIFYTVLCLLCCFSTTQPLGHTRSSITLFVFSFHPLLPG